MVTNLNKIKTSSKVLTGSDTIEKTGSILETRKGCLTQCFPLYKV